MYLQGSGFPYAKCRKHTDFPSQVVTTDLLNLDCETDHIDKGRCAGWADLLPRKREKEEIEMYTPGFSFSNPP